MGRIPDNNVVAPYLVLHFLRKTFPFNELDDTTISSLAKRCAIAHYPKGQLIFKQDVTEVMHFHIVQRGGVKAFLSSDDTVVTLQDFCGEGESFGALPLLSGQKADFNVEAVEDTFCFLIDKDAFLEVVRNNPGFEKYYSQRFSEDFVYAVYSELRQEKIKSRSEAAFYLFNLRVRDILKALPDVIDGSASVKQAGERMAELHVDFLLVRNETRSIVGLVTTADLRTKVVAAGLDYSTPVREVMSTPLVTIPAQANCFEALLRMIKEEIHHLAVEHRKMIIGLISAHDIIVYQGAAFLYPFREIQSQRKISGLYSISQKVPIVVRTLLEEGARADHVAKVITVFNDNLMSRLLWLLCEELGSPPVPFCWLTLGSEGRKEQTFRTDQDNALVYADTQDASTAAQVEEYFRTFAERAVEHLEACGYPRCRNKFMASNPRWCKPLSVWKQYFDEWMKQPIPPEVGLFRIFFDFRASHGDFSLADSLRDFLAHEAPRSERFLKSLANDCLLNSPPLSFMGNQIVEKDGRHTDMLDLKTRGLTPLVNVARLMALRHGIKETGTLARLRLLAENKHIPRELYAEAREAYEFQTQLTLVTQLEMLEAGLPPDNFIRPADLSDLERKTLKETFAVIDRLLAHVRREFRVELSSSQ